MNEGAAAEELHRPKDHSKSQKPEHLTHTHTRASEHPPGRINQHVPAHTLTHTLTHTRASEHPPERINRHVPANTLTHTLTHTYTHVRQSIP